MRKMTRDRPYDNDVVDYEYDDDVISIADLYDASFDDSLSISQSNPSSMQCVEIDILKEKGEENVVKLPMLSSSLVLNKLLPKL